MFSHTHLLFNSYIGGQKPENIINKNTKCPFCDTANLENILAKQGNIIWLKNKYPVLEDTLMTVLIETDQCNSELSLYPKEHLYAVMHFAMEKWLAMEATDEFRSVIFYKNHGPLSGGTIRHPHMQIVGLRSLDYQRYVLPEHFEGLPVITEPGVTFNISTKPRMGFFEFNIRLDDQAYLNRWADCIQAAAHYCLNHFHKYCTSYNIFFYALDGVRWAKVVPRFATSPLFVGYSIPQVSTRLDDVLTELKQLYF